MIGRFTFFLLGIGSTILVASGTVDAAYQPVAQPLPTPAASAQGAQTRSDASLLRLRNSEDQMRNILQRKEALRKTYNLQLSEIDRLKRGRASFRRDRQLRAQKALSQKTALKLSALDKDLQRVGTLVTQNRGRALVAIRGELALLRQNMAVKGAAASRLQTLQSSLKVLEQGLRKAPRKIAIPDLNLDEFADPEELLEQLALIDRAEVKLSLEAQSLQKRARYYGHMDALHSKRQRAAELSALDEDGVRRVTGRVEKVSAQTGDDDPSNDSSGGPGPSPVPPTGGSGGGVPEADDPGNGPIQQSETDSFTDTSLVLADVVDTETQAALRRAQFSRSPQTKATAAKRAHGQVQTRIQRLRATRARIQQRLRELQSK